MKKIVKSHNILLKDGQNAVLRQLRPNDTVKIVDFLSKLSLQTRQFYTLDDYGIKTAEALCKSLTKPEKLHFVIEVDSSEIIALVKLSLDLPEADRLRFDRYGANLISGQVCRWGICIADKYQNAGIGRIALEHVIEVSEQYEQKVIISSGGIFANNERAINLCNSYGFKIVGKFTDINGRDHVDMLREA